jgi:ferritin-like metal-binding protein YciE
MAVETMDDLFLETLKDIYYAEKQILKALPAMVKKSQTPKLKKLLETHRGETLGQIERLEAVFELLGEKPRGKKCDAIEGIIKEGKEHMTEIKDELVRDAGIITSAQAVEHYEICRYGTLVSWAELLGHTKVARLLGQTLKEEKNADALLSGLAESVVNQHAKMREAA